MWFGKNKPQTGTMPSATRLVVPLFLCHMPELAARASLPTVTRARTRFLPARVPARLRVVQHWRVRRSSSSSSSKSSSSSVRMRHNSRSSNRRSATAAGDFSFPPIFVAKAEVEYRLGASCWWGRGEMNFCPRSKDRG